MPVPKADHSDPKGGQGAEEVSRRPAIEDPEVKQALLAWFDDYQRVGTLKDKARELQVDEETLRDTIKRLRGEMTRPTRRKILDAELNQQLDDIMRDVG
jgi:hypothetical protein